MAEHMAKILVVDDDAPILDLLTEILEECGHEALRAANGQEALQLAQLYHPEVIISDIMMPEMNGYELLKAIRTIPDLARTVVVLASAGVSKLSSVTTPFKADGYMQKPFNLSQIEQLLQSFGSGSYNAGSISQPAA